MPTRLTFRRVIAAANRRGSRFRTMAKRSLTALLPRRKSDCLYAVYDLNFYPVSFDLCWFLAAADVERQRRGLRGVQVIFVAFARPFVHSMPPGHEDHVDDASMVWRVENILIPICGLLPTCEGAAVIASRKDVELLVATDPHVWPKHWTGPGQPTLPEIYRAAISGLSQGNHERPLAASPQGLRYIQSWKQRVAGERLLVTITLRQHRGGAVRNSNLQSWIAFARAISNSRFLPVFVADTEHAFDLPPELAEFQVSREAPWNIGVRMALYESAYLNLFVNNGPASLCTLSKRCRYLMFKVATESLRLTSVGYLAELGFVQHESPAFASPYQKWVWNEDSLPVLSREFRLMSDTIDGSSTREVNFTDVPS